MNWYLFIVPAMILLLAGCTERPQETNQLSFEKSIIADAEAKYPDADIIEIEGREVVGGISMTNVRVTFNSTSICPVRMRLRYKSPDFGYETGIPTYIVNDCKYECVGTCVITSEEVAIVAAHTLDGSDDVKEFIGDGQGIVAKATYDKLEDNWTVTFTKTDTGEAMRVVISAKNPVILATVAEQ